MAELCNPEEERRRQEELTRSLGQVTCRYSHDEGDLPCRGCGAAL